MRKRLLIVVIVLCGCIASLVVHYKIWEVRGVQGYWRLKLGMTESEVEGILGGPGRDYRPVRHVGGITSPGTAEVPLAEFGLPRANLPRPNDPTAEVMVKQWWGSSYGIDVAFDKNGQASGIYLCRLKSFGLD